MDETCARASRSGRSAEAVSLDNHRAPSPHFSQGKDGEAKINGAKSDPQLCEQTHLGTFFLADLDISVEKRLLDR